MDKERPVKITLHFETGINVTFNCEKYVQDDTGSHYYGVVPKKVGVDQC